MGQHTLNRTDDHILIHHIHGRFFIFDVNVVALLRNKYHILGVLSGSLAQASQQNIFLGLPLQLIKEEASWLVYHKIGIIVDDHEVFESRARSVTAQDIEAFHAHRRNEAAEQERKASAAADQRRRVALLKQGKSEEQIQAIEERAAASALSKAARHSDQPWDNTIRQVTVPAGAPADTFAQWANTTATLTHYGLDFESSRFAVFNYLHNRGYFLHPGLRFGGEFVAYPGDPLRFHSHFSVTTREWNQPIPLMSIVGGGRLGTGVKKAWLLASHDDTKHIEDEDAFRCFCIEWSGFG